MTVATLLHRNTPTEATTTDVLVRLGRTALVTQGLLYGIVGLLAIKLASGDEGATPSQKGAIASVARQPFGRVLLVALAVGLGAHAAWRLALAIRGEPGHDEDGGSVAKRAANAARALLYASFTLAAIQILTRTSGQDDSAPRRSTAVVLGWPGGRVLVVGAGLCVAGAAVWNLRKAVTRTFLDNLDLGRLDDRPRRIVEVVGVIGYLARAGAFGLVAWFLVQAGLDADAGETKGLDDSLRALVAGDHGPLLLALLAGGLVLFGAFRVVDGCYRKPSEITYA